MIKNKISELSAYLQSLTAPKFNKRVEEAVEKKDKDALLKICKSAKIPSEHHGTVVSVLLSMSSPQQKYPEFM